jgi:hypothetical protein
MMLALVWPLQTVTCDLPLRPAKAMRSSPVPEKFCVVIDAPPRSRKPGLLVQPSDIGEAPDVLTVYHAPSPLPPTNCWPNRTV